MASKEPFDLDLDLNLDVDIALDFDIDQKDETEDPLADVEYVGQMEPDSKAELRALEKAFVDQSRQFTNQLAQADQRNDSEYWICVCFQSRAQKDEFLANSGLILDGDKYLDGQVVAKKLGIALSPPPPPLKQGRIDKTWADMALEKE